MGLINLEQYTDKQNRAISRVLDTLDRLDKITTAHYSDKRKHERKNFRGVVWINTVPELNSENDVFSTTKVWSRSISQSGLSFIYPSPIQQTQIQVGIPAEETQIIWFRAEIVRQREVEEEKFWEYGVKFLGKLIV